MDDFVSKIRGASPDQMIDLLHMGDETARLWRPEELEAIFRHQMTAPVTVDLGAFDAARAGRLSLLAEADGLLLKSFGDLFQHPAPPPEFLRLVKDFAKRNRESPNSPLPREIAPLLYYLSIAAALVRHQARITSLETTRLRHGLAWAAGRNWIDTPARELLLLAVAALSKDKPEATECPKNAGEQG